MTRSAAAALCPMVLLDGEVRLPDSIVDLQSFRQWANSPESPERGRYCFLNGEIWVDVEPEQLFSHNQLKGAISRVLFGIGRDGIKGMFCADGVRFSNVEANLSAQPDGLYVTYASLKKGHARLVPDGKGGLTEFEGTPDMVFEVLSHSIKKDRVILRDLYWKARVPEYWLADGRGDSAELTILRWSRRGYVQARPQRGWVRSAIFRKSFRLTQKPDRLGYPDYTLHAR